MHQTPLYENTIFTRAFRSVQRIVSSDDLREFRRVSDPDGKVDGLVALNGHES